MATNPDNPDNLEFTTRCLPGSPAERQEQERMEAFRRAKALRDAEAERRRPEEAARRLREHEAAAEEGARRRKGWKSAR